MGQFGGLPGTQAGVAPGAGFRAHCRRLAGGVRGVCKGIAAYNYDQAKLPEIAASRGIPAFSWDEATKGWNGRIKANAAVAQRFNQLYRES